MKALQLIWFLLSSAFAAAPAWSADSAPALHEHAHLRRPISLAFAQKRLYVANQRGTISIVDPQCRAVLSEVAVGRRLADLAPLRVGRFLLAVDEAAHELILLACSENEVKPIQRLSMPHTPVTVAVDSEGSRCFVASLWARQVTAVDVHWARGTPRLSIAATLDLPFAPRKQVFVPPGTVATESRLTVADSFSGELAVIDPVAPKLLWTRRIPGHNIRGLALSHDGREVLLAHQILDEKSGTDYESVFWGGVMINVLRTVDLADVLSPEPPDRNVTDIFGTHALGHPGSATGDPADILVTSAGQTVVCLSGVGELAMRSKPTAPFDRFETGRRPTALALDDGEALVYVANTADDTISILDLSSMQMLDEISLGPRPELTDGDRGEDLFYDARLSLNGWYSCHSCHTDGHTNGRLSDNLGDDYFGDPKRIPSLLGTADTGPWAWHGGVPSLEQQLRKSIRITMQGNVAQDEDVRALEAFLKQLTPPPSLARARGMLDAAGVERGRRLFETQGCAECHRPSAYTTARTYDVGVHDKRGTKEFNPPSLRGVSQRAPYFHDNRAATLRSVLADHAHGGGDLFSDQEFADLLAFLESL